MSLLKQSIVLARRCLIQNTCSFKIQETRTIKRWVAPTLHELYKRKQKAGVQPKTPRSAHLEWNYEAEIFAFGKRLGEEFDKDILKQAFIQRDFANLEEIKAREKGVEYRKVHNFGLIGEGSEIIDKYIDEVYGKLYPSDIAKAIKDYLTSEEVLAYVSKHLGTGDLIKANEFPVENINLANTFKAVVAAVNRSQDLDRAQLFVKDFLLCQLHVKDIFDIWCPEKPYEYLTNILNEKGITDVEPRLCNESATNTILATFQVGLYSNKQLLGIGWGENVQTAKDTAALNAIDRIYNLNKNSL